MIKLLNYKREKETLICNFEKGQRVTFYAFGKDVFSITSDGITKSAIKEIKQKLEKEGLDCSLEEFINVEVKEYGE
jgi:hypothetical protein